MIDIRAHGCNLFTSPVWCVYAYLPLRNVLTDSCSQIAWVNAWSYTVLVSYTYNNYDIWDDLTILQTYARALYIAALLHLDVHGLDEEWKSSVNFEHIFVQNNYCSRQYKDHGITTDHSNLFLHTRIMPAGINTPGGLNTINSVMFRFALGFS